jgi:hypothetical protein
VLTLALFAALLAPASTLDSLRFLQGDWIAEGGSFSLQPELDGKILVRRNHSQPAGAKAHEDLMVIHPGGADYWDNEGHVIHYAVTADGKSAVFLSREDGAGPRFRLTYVSTGANTVSIKFEVAPPGKPFQTYLEGKAQRKP